MRTIASVVLTTTLLFAAHDSDAAVVTLDSAARGWVDSNGFVNGRAAGNTTFTGFAAGTGDVNSWYGFDLSSVSGNIVAAELLFDIAPYVSPDASETLVFYSVETAPGELGTMDSAAQFIDLMTGDVFGSRVFSAADENNVRSIALNSTALLDMNAATVSLWEVGAHISTLSRVGRFEAIFFGAFGDPTTTRLRVTSVPEQSVPEPATLGLVSLGFAVLGRRRTRPAKVRPAQ